VADSGERGGRNSDAEPDTNGGTRQPETLTPFSCPARPPIPHPLSIVQLPASKSPDGVVIARSAAYHPALLAPPPERCAIPL